MTFPRTAEVAGGGVAIATALAQHGWGMRVHERAAELRIFGAVIWMREDGLGSLRLIGAEEQMRANARHIRQWAVFDHNGKSLVRRDFSPDDPMVLPLRADLYQALIQPAERSGVESLTGSAARGATLARRVAAPPHPVGVRRIGRARSC